MKPRPAPPNREVPSDTPLASAERSELQRQGAKAAARGEATAANPLRESRNKPAATGESPDTWSQRSDAWEQGHRAQSETRQEDARDGHDKGDLEPDLAGRPR